MSHGAGVLIGGRRRDKVDSMGQARCGIHVPCQNKVEVVEKGMLQL